MAISNQNQIFYIIEPCLLFKMTLTLAGVAEWIEQPACEPKGHQFDSQSRAHAWVVGQVPSRWHERGNHTLMFLPLSLSLPSPLSKNKNK